MIRSPVLKALSLSLSFYRKIDNQGLGDRANRSCNNCLFSIGGYWRFGSEYSDNFFAFLRCVFESSKLSTKDVSERIEFGVLGNRYKCTPCFNCIHVVGWSKFLMTIVAHSKSNDWELYCRVIYTGEVRERQKVFEREVVGKNWTFNSFLGHENVFHHDELVVGTWWCTAWLRHISIMSTTENYHAGLSLQRHLGTGGVVSCLRVAQAFFSFTLLYLNRWNTETLFRMKRKNCMPLMETGN